MNDTKRMLRRLEQLPSSLFTEWERGVIYGMIHGLNDENLLAKFDTMVLTFGAEEPAEAK
jgi:hypothetical protein